LSLKEEDVDLLEELFLQEGIIFDPNSITDIDSACQDTGSEEISLLMQAVEELKGTVEEVAQHQSFKPSSILAAVVQIYPCLTGCQDSKVQGLILAFPLQLADENQKLRRELEVAREIAAQAQLAAAAGAAAARSRTLLDFVPAPLLRPFGFVPD